MRREDEFEEAMPLDPRVERALSWMRAHLPGFNPGLAALERETTAGGTLIAGGLAYRLFLWLVPFGVVIAAVASFWERADPNGLESSAEDFGLTATAAETAANAVEQGAHGRWYFLIIGLVLLQWFAMGVVRALRLAHRVAWGAPREKFRRPIPAGLLFTLFAAALIVVSGAAQWAREEVGAVGLIVTLLLALVYAAGALWAMVRFSSPRRTLDGADTGSRARRPWHPGPEPLHRALPRAEARPVLPAVRLAGRGDGDPALALHHRPPDHAVRVPERDALGAPQGRLVLGATQ